MAKRGDIRVCLDVFDPEPIPAGSEIRDLPNVFLSPHIAGVTAACWPRFFSFMVDEVERFAADHETMFDLPHGPWRTGAALSHLPSSNGIETGRGRDAAAGRNNA